MPELTQKEFAELKHCHPSTVGNAIRRGEIIILDSGRIDPDENTEWKPRPRGYPVGRARKARIAAE